VKDLLVFAKDLAVTAPSGVQLVSQVTLEIGRGKRIALLGASGAGKSLLTRALAGLLPENFTRSGLVREHLAEGQKKLRILYLVQQAMNAWDPLVRLGTQLGEGVPDAARSKSAFREKLRTVLGELGFAEPERILAHYPCELSGGMLQRTMLAAAMINPPDLVIADETVGALDAALREESLERLDTLRKAHGTTVMLITHDLKLAANWADELFVMDAGRLVEHGGPEILLDPHAPATRRLIAGRMLTVNAAQAHAAAAPQNASAAPFIEVKNLTRRHRTGWRRSNTVFENLSFTLRRGEVLGLVAPSGTGKSTLSRLLLGLEKPDAGSITFEGMAQQDWISAHPGALSVVFQDYIDSLNPTMRVRDLLLEPLRILGRPLEGEAEKLISMVGLGEARLNAYAHMLSGGEAQRIALARALSASPQFVVFDEALSSLDAAVSGSLVALLKTLKTPDMTWLFITHDTELAAAMCDRILLMEKGAIAGELSAAELFHTRRY